MPFIPHTPESLVRRSDSKDPATTCKGITSSGRPCRRPLGTSPQCSPTAPRKSKNGVVAILEQEDDEHDGAAAFFCWQHQDQAETLTSGDQSGRRANIIPLHPRTSIDTLVDRLGILDVEGDESPTKAKTKRSHTRPARKETLPQKWQDVDGPLLAVNSGMGRTDSKRKSNLGLFCCIRSVNSDPLPPPRRRQDPEKPKHTQNGTSRIPSFQTTASSNSYVVQLPANKTTASGSPLPSRASRPSGLPPASSRPSAGRHRPSQTEYFLSLIPKTLSPQTTAVLLAELAKPTSPHDEEGFIYMFWLTDGAVSAPDSHAASSLLVDTIRTTLNGRRRSDVLQAHGAQSHGNGAAVKQATLLLKIGRASNVQRRMNEWTRQCGYNLSIIRFYPHVSSSSPRPSSGSPPVSPNGPAKVPHAHKVERLIHLELADQRVKRNCASCGKEHREWFEVESSRQGLKTIDDVIRRWTGWGQRMGAST